MCPYNVELLIFVKTKSEIFVGHNTLCPNIQMLLRDIL